MVVASSTVIALVATVAGLLYVKDLRLPYPCFDVVQSIPSEQAGAPSDLRGPYAINHVLNRATKLFENQLYGVGTTPRITCLCVHAGRARAQVHFGTLS